MNTVNDMAVSIIGNCLTGVKWRIQDEEFVRAKIELESIIATLKSYSNSGYLSFGEAGVFRVVCSEFAEKLGMPRIDWTR